MGMERLNKKGLQFRNAFFALIVLGVVVTSMGIIIATWSDYYGTGIGWNLGSFDQSGSVYDTTGDYTNSLNNQTSGSADYQSNIYQASYGIITNLISPFAMVFGQNGMLYSIGTMFGIPSYIIIAIVSMIIIALVFAFIAIIFKQFKNTV